MTTKNKNSCPDIGTALKGQGNEHKHICHKKSYISLSMSIIRLYRNAKVSQL